MSDLWHASQVMLAVLPALETLGALATSPTRDEADPQQEGGGR